MRLLEADAEKRKFYIRAIDDVFNHLLSECEAKIITKKYVEGMLTDRGIGMELGLSRATFYRHLNNALKKFKDRMFI